MINFLPSDDEKVCAKLLINLELFSVMAAKVSIISLKKQRLERLKSDFIYLEGFYVYDLIELKNQSSCLSVLLNFLLAYLRTLA